MLVIKSQKIIEQAIKILVKNQVGGIFSFFSFNKVDAKTNI